jgi:hypothetical protein
MRVFCLSLSPITSILWLACSLHAYILICLFIVYMFVVCVFVIYLCHLFVVRCLLFTCATYVVCSLHVYVTYSSPTCITYSPTCCLLRYPPNLLLVRHLLPCSLPPFVWYCPLTYMCKFKNEKRGGQL